MFHQTSRKQPNQTYQFTHGQLSQYRYLYQLTHGQLSQYRYLYQFTHGQLSQYRYLYQCIHGQLSQYRYLYQFTLPIVTVPIFVSVTTMLSCLNSSSESYNYLELSAIQCSKESCQPQK